MPDWKHCRRVGYPHRFGDCLPGNFNVRRNTDLDAIWMPLSWAPGFPARPAGRNPKLLPQSRL